MIDILDHELHIPEDEQSWSGLLYNEKLIYTKNMKSYQLCCHDDWEPDDPSSSGFPIPHPHSAAVWLLRGRSNHHDDQQGGQKQLAPEKREEKS